MAENISVKILKLKEKSAENGKNYALYEVEAFNYGDHNYSSIQIEYQNESDLEKFNEGKSINIKVGEDMTKGEGTTLVINGGTWNADRTVWQKVKDTSEKIGDTSAQAVKKTGEGFKKAGAKLETSANENKWPRWVLPVTIVIGVLFLIGILAWIFKGKKR